jgi:tetratricopeptide (TPR) repeat protein
MKLLSFPQSAIKFFLIVMLGLSVVACSSPEQRAKAHYQSGKTLLDSGEYAKAGLEFRNALKFQENFADAWYGLALVEEKNQNWQAVNQSLQKVVELDKKNADAFFRLAKVQFASMKLDDALKNVNAANDLKKDDSATLALRAAVLFRLNDKDGARTDAEKALALNPDNADAHAVLAADQMASGNTVAALQFIDRGLKGDPNNLGLLMFKLKIYEDAKDDTNMEAVLRKIIETNPQVKDLRRALVDFLARRNRVADLEKEMRAWVAADPIDTGTGLDLVRLIRQTKGADAARQEMLAMIAAHPTIGTYKLALAHSDFMDNKIDDALAMAQTVADQKDQKEDSTRAKLLIAEIKNRTGKPEEGKALINGVLESDAKNVEALAMRAGMRLQANEVDNAVADLREALNQQPQSVQLLQMLARAHERQGAVNLAIDRMGEATKVSNYDPGVVLDYVALLGRQNKGDQAELLVNDALTRHPNDERLLTTLAQMKLNKQDWAGAQEVADTLKKINTKSVISDQISGAVQLGQKDFSGSIETLKGAYTAAPQSARAMDTLVYAYLQAGKTDEAQAFLKTILDGNPNNAAALALQGAVQASVKKPEEAEASFKLAIERQPKQAVGYAALAKFYMSQKRGDDAFAVLKQGNANVPTDMQISLGLANQYEARGDTESAIKLYDAQLAITPDALIIVNNLASLLADYRTDAASYEKAYQLSRRLDTSPMPEFKDTVGWVAYRKGDYRTALLRLEEANEKLPKLPLIKYHLAMTYAALKRTADAKAMLTDALGLVADGDPLKATITSALAGLPSN